MTNEQKVDALSELLSNVIHSLEMTKYEIGDVSEAANVIRSRQVSPTNVRHSLQQ